MADRTRAEPPLHPAAQGYAALFNEIAILAQLSRARIEARLPDGVTFAQFGVLNHLTRLGDGQTPLALARAFQVPKTTMSHVLAGLAARGLVAVAPNPRDGRGKIVRLTAAGAAFRGAALASVAPDILRIAAALPAELPDGLLPGLAQLRMVLDRDRDGNGDADGDADGDPRG